MFIFLCGRGIVAVHWASTPGWTSNPDTRVRIPSPAPRKKMAKKIYTFPLKKVLELVKNNKTLFKEPLNNKNLLEYYKLIGKSYYILEIKKFIEFFKLNKDTSYALKILEMFNSRIFINEIIIRLNFSQFKLEEFNVLEKDFFYAFLYVLKNIDEELFELFLEKFFIHYYTTVHMPSNIKINFKEMSIAIAKTRGLVVKESFKEISENLACFKIIENGKVVIHKEGKSIKTLRKKAFKEYFYLLNK